MLDKVKSLLSIAIILTWALNSLAAGAYAGEVFNEDVTITDAVIPQGEYEGAVIRGNLTIACTVVGQQAFKDAIIVGDVTIEANIVSPEAFKDAVIGGTCTVNDDATVDATAFTSKYDGKIIKGDITYYGAYNVGREAYKGKVIIGDVSIERSFVSYGSFSHTVIIGNLTIERVVADEYGFTSAKVTGDINVKRTVGYNYSFNDITAYGENSFDEVSLFLNSSCHLNKNPQFAKDTTLSDDFIATEEYYDNIIYGDLTFNNMVINDLAFDGSIFLGDIYFQNSIAYADAFLYTHILGSFSHDENSYFGWEMPESESHAGDVFENDVKISETIVAAGQYKGATFKGNLSIECRFIDKQAFENAIVLGDLTVRSKTVGHQAFRNAVVSGKVAIEEPTETIDSEAFRSILSAIPEFAFPASLQKIGSHAFRSVQFSDLMLTDCRNLKRISEMAFYDSSWESLVLPIPENHLIISRLAFYQPQAGDLSSKARTIFMPQHLSENINYGTPYLDEYGEEFGLDIEDIITPNDIVYLWLDPNNIECLWDTYGNGRLTVTEYGGDYSVTGFPYSLEPTVQSYGNGRLYVPRGCKQKLIEYLKPFKYTPIDESGGRFPPAPYYFIPIYSYFKEGNIIEIDMYDYPYCELNPYPGGVGQVGSGTSNAVEVARYDINGRPLSNPTQGINIVRYSDGTVKKVVNH